MPVVLRHNELLELNMAEYHGSISLEELLAVAGFLTENPGFLKFDNLAVVHSGTDFDGVALDALDQIFGQYKKLYAPINFEIIRRSAWICLSPAAQGHIDHWCGKRDVREAMSTTLQQFTTYEQAGDWLVLAPTETETLRTGEGFAELARFDSSAIPSQRAAG